MEPHCIAILPAGGTGNRFGSEMPKLYTVVQGRPVLAHSIEALLTDSRVEKVYVALSPEYLSFLDWATWQGRVVPLTDCVGSTRAKTVSLVLRRLYSTHQTSDWVLVHDAVRPCLSLSSLQRLLDAVWADRVGGLLAIPVADTLKHSDGTGRVQATVDRNQLWAAQTPQMFPLGLLTEALEKNPEATDEASAMEALGHSPLLVQGEKTNLKVTYPDDLVLVASILEALSREETT